MSTRRAESLRWTGAVAPACACLTCLLLLVAALGCDRQDGPADAEDQWALDKVFEKGPLTVHVKLDKDTLTIAETLQLRLEASIAEGYDLTMPSLVEVLGKYEFGVLDFKAEADKLDDQGRRLVCRQYRLEPIVSGTFNIGALSFAFTEHAGPSDAQEQGTATKAADEQSTYELLTEPIPVEVSSMLAEDRADMTIADIKPVATLPGPLSWAWLWWLAGAGVLVAVILVWMIWRRRGRRGIVRTFKPAHELAYERLSELVAADYIAAGRVKEFYERISWILRRYIEDRFDLRAPEQTTEEFLPEARTKNVLDESQQQMLCRFLEHCDLVKFARYGPATAEIQQTFDLTRQFIEATRLNEKQVDVTDMAQTSGEAAGTVQASDDTLMRSV